MQITGQLRSILTGTAVLGIAALVALYLTLARGRLRADGGPLRALTSVAALAILCQTAHFVEELATGFPRRFPALLGLATWPLGFFVPFNLAWLALWTLCLGGLRARRRVTLWPLWFLALGSLANGVGHPALALAAGGYFPGLVTAPAVGVAGVVLFRRLLAATGTVAPADTP